MKRMFLFCALFPAALLAQTTTFSFTGSAQYYVVPANVTMVNIDVRGAQGGSISNLSQPSNTAVGGLGGRVVGDLNVTPGDTIWVYVGNVGESSGGTLTCDTLLGGWNGGGNGFSGYNSYNYNSGGGGGASDVRFGGQSLASRILVGGGGGGAGCSGCTGGGFDGGAGGGTTGGDGVNASCFTNCQNGKGGTQSAGGNFGTWSCNCSTVDATAGSLGTGGKADGSGCAVTCGSGGGGGGGYYGGGGGSLGPGGGGSSYASGSFTNVVHTQGYQQGAGMVVFSVLTTTDNLSGTAFLFNVYPNPATDLITVSLNGNLPASGEFILTDITGRICGEWKWNGLPEEKLDLSAVSGGAYTFTFKSGFGTVARKITVSR